MRRVKAAIAMLAVMSLGATGTGRERELQSLPVCEKPRLVSTTDWIRLSQGDGFVLQLPPCFQPDTEAPRYVHGGKRWRCETATVEVVWGMWGAGSFGEREACRSVLGAVPVLVARKTKESGLGVLVWYLTGGIHEPMISAFGGTDADVLTTIAHSGRLTVARGPNR